MRTKALLLTAALGLAGAATSMAQVYSVNAVGYVNSSIPVNPALTTPTYAIVANPLKGVDNKLSTVMPTVPDGTQVYFFRGGTFVIKTYFGGWLDDTTWDPGEAAFLEIPAGSANPTVITWVGEVSQGHLVNPIPDGYSLRASIVPQQGPLNGLLGLTLQDGNQVYQFDVPSQAYVISTWFGGFLGADPVVNVAEGFFVENLTGAGYDWVRDFQVSP